MVLVLTAYSTQERSSSRMKHRRKIERWNNRRYMSTSRVHVADVVLYAVRFFESLSFIIQFLINIEDPVCWSVNHRPTGNLSSFPFVGEMFSIHFVPLIHLLKQVPYSKPVVIFSQLTNFFLPTLSTLQLLSHNKSLKWLKYCLNQVQTYRGKALCLVFRLKLKSVTCRSLCDWIVFSLWNLTAAWNQASECSHLIAFGKTQGWLAH